MGRVTRFAARRLVTVMLAGLVMVAVVAVAVVFLNRPGDGSSAGPLEPMPGPDPGLSVNALAIEPGDGSLYAGARFGLFRITETGEAARVANRQQETHALAVLGPGHLLASGHPDPRESLPSKLGLVESTDGGESFTAPDMGPQITVLAWPRDAVLFGVTADGQVQLSTDDGRTWGRRGRVDGLPQAIVDDESRVFVATDTGVHVSDDGARTFALHYQER